MSQRTTTLYAYLNRGSGDFDQTFMDFDSLMTSLHSQSMLKGCTILWDTLRLSSEEVTVDDSTILEPAVQSWITWSAQVLAYYGEEE